MSARLAFNPVSGDFEFQPNKNAAQKVQETFDCSPATAIGDLVVPSLTSIETVEPINSNYYDNLVFGVVVAKPTATRATVLVSGKLSGGAYQLSGLTFGKCLYISSLGKLTTTPPATGHLQALGIALKSDVVFLLPSMTKVIRP